MKGKKIFQERNLLAWGLILFLLTGLLVLGQIKVEIREILNPLSSFLGFISGLLFLFGSNKLRQGAKWAIGIFLLLGVISFLASSNILPNENVNLLAFLMLFSDFLTFALLSIIGYLIAEKFAKELMTPWKCIVIAYLIIITLTVMGAWSKAAGLDMGFFSLLSLILTLILLVAFLIVSIKTIFRLLKK